MFAVLLILSLVTLLSVAAVAGLLALLVDYRQVALQAARLRAESQIDEATRATLQAMREAVFKSR